MQSSSSGSSLGGCLKAVGLIYLVAMALAVVVGAAQSSPVAGLVVAVLIVGGWVATARWLKGRRDAKALAFAQAQAAEHQRQLAAYHAEQERQRLAHEAEQARQRHERWTYLSNRYGEEIAGKIWAGRLWVGCTVDMMIEILGHAAGVDEKVLKTKTNYTYKYKPTGANRYALRVYVTDDEVTGWEDKSD